ncbi:hypothetical protein [Secundilactobacillus kimchicus]|uniref:hypothetical protein n=1 Tax=Secundilactobacillus kimchicus TaxID=528209 RepID=UPI0024A8A836|nr:hypothetical protein [Secundilactobacillus kimchicus]
MEFTDVYGFKHEDCKIVRTTGKYGRILIIEDPYKVRFVCVKPDAEAISKNSQHWSPASPQDAPEDYFGNFKRNTD